MPGIVAIAIKDLKLLIRDRAGAFFTLIFPLGIAFFFGLMFGGGGDSSRAMKIVLVDEDGGPAARAFADDLTHADGLEVKAAPTRAEGVALVRKGKVAACVLVPQGFQAQSENMFFGGAMKIEGLVDPARKAEAGLLTGKLNEIAFKQMFGGMSEPDRMESLLSTARAAATASPTLDAAQRGTLLSMFDSLDSFSKTRRRLDATDPSASAPADAKPKSDSTKRGFAFKPVEVSVTEVKPEDNQPQSAFDLSFPQGIVWGLMGCVTAFGASMASERAGGTLMRLAVSPIRPSGVLLGKALGCFVACMAVQALVIAAGMLLVGVKVRQPGLMGVAMVCAAIGFVGVMAIMAGLCKTEAAAGGMGRAVILVLAMIGGGTIPVVFMPAWMQTVSGISPFKWAADAIQGAMWRGLSPSEMLVPCGVLVGMGVVGYAIGAVMMRRSIV